MIFTMGVVVLLMCGLIGAVNDLTWDNAKLDKLLRNIFEIGVVMVLYSLLKFAWNTLP